jgi:molybdopterin-binding protein
MMMLSSSRAPPFRGALFFGEYGRGENRPGGGRQMLSARNQFKGAVKSVKLGTVMAEVVVTVGANEVVSLISRTSAEALKLKAGDQVTAVIKATEVMVAKDL